MDATTHQHGPACTACGGNHSADKALFAALAAGREANPNGYPPTRDAVRAAAEAAGFRVTTKGTGFNFRGKGRSGYAMFTTTGVFRTGYMSKMADGRMLVTSRPGKLIRALKEV